MELELSLFGPVKMADRALARFARRPQLDRSARCSRLLIGSPPDAFTEIILSQHMTPARALAEAAFKKLQSPTPPTESQIQAQTVREQTARLRKLRLAKAATQRE